jgi:porin
VKSNLWRRLTWAALIVLGIGAPGFGQTEPIPSDPPPQEAGAPEEAAKGTLPVPDYSGDWATRRFLTGDWGGIREEWAKHGVTFGLRWLQVGQGVVDGGVDERWDYVTNLDYTITLDLMRMGLLPGAVISFRGQSRFGESVNLDTGMLLPVNTYSNFPLTTPPEEDVPFAITELNYLQFLSDTVGVLLGKITTMGGTNEFSGGEGRSQFMNFQLMFSGATAQVAPYATLAAGGLWLPCPNVKVTSMLMNTADSSTTTGFDDVSEGSTWSTSVDVQYRVGDLPGGATFTGLYAFDGDFARIGGISLVPGLGIAIDRERRTWVLSASGWQYLCTEKEPPETLDPTDGRQDLEGLGVFALVGLADKDTNPVAWSAAGGLSGRGTIPGRDDDTWGVGFFYNDLQRPQLTFTRNLLDGSTWGLEAYYNVAVTGSAALTLDAQWVEGAIRQVDDAVVLGVRLNIDF